MSEKIVRELSNSHRTQYRSQSTMLAIVSGHKKDVIAADEKPIDTSINAVHCDLLANAHFMPLARPN